MISPIRLQGAILLPVRELPKRWLVYSAGVGLALVTIWGVERQGSRPVSSARVQASAERSLPATVAAEPARIPELELGRLAPRLPAETSTDLFGRSWRELEAEDARRNAPQPAPPPPQAPPLPFAYLGKLFDAGTTVIFLAKGDRNYVVRSGDTIDGTYRVDEIGERAMMLTYLPLDSKQSLGVGEPASSLPVVAQFPAGAPVAEAPRPVAPAGPAQLVWLAPPRVEIGEEFTVEVGLPSGPQPRSGRVELVYDPRILALLGGAAASGGTTAKRAVVDVIGPGFPGAAPTPSEVRFRVLAADPTTTQIAIENLSAVAAGSPIAVTAPSAHRLAVARSKGTREGPD